MRSRSLNFQLLTETKYRAGEQIALVRLARLAKQRHVGHLPVDRQVLGVFAKGLAEQLERLGGAFRFRQCQRVARFRRRAEHGHSCDFWIDFFQQLEPFAEETGGGARVIETNGYTLRKAFAVCKGGTR